MRLAIISDIHANLPALEAVLADIEGLGVDQIVVNGDVVNRGPSNDGVLARLQDAPVQLTRGNHDDLMLKWVARDPDIPAEWYGHPFWEGTAGWAVAQLLKTGWLEALRDLPMTHEVALPGAPTLLISHGSPRHYREGYGSYLTEEKYAEIAGLYPADILIGSHIHRPYEYPLGARLFLNTSAVGSPFNGDPRAQYLLMSWHRGRWAREWRAVPYDQGAALAAFERSGFLEEGGLSAFIFSEELRYATSLHAPFWFWAEERGKPLGWPSWHQFRAEYEPPPAPPMGPLERWHEPL